MADPRLRYNEVAAPDFSGASQALARANDSFNKGFVGGQDLLAKYAAGQQEKGDSELLSEIAALGNEAEFDSFVDGGGLRNRNISDDMRQHVLGLRSGLVGDANTRAGTDSTRARTGIALAGEARTAAEEADRIAVRNAERGAAGSILAGVEYGRNNGQIVGDEITVQNTGDRRVAYRDGIAGIESAGSGDYNAVGPTHETLGRALGRYQIMEANIPQWSREALGQEITAEEFMANPDLQDAIFDHKFGTYVDEFGEEGAAQAWFGGEGGVGKTERTDSLGRVNIGEYGQTFVDSLGNTGQTTTRPTPVGAAQQGLIDTGLFSADRIRQMMQPVRDAENVNETEEQSRIAEAEAESAAQAALALVQDPNNQNQTDVVLDAFNNPDLSAVDRIALADQAANLGAAAPGVLSPNVQEDARVTAVQDQITRDLENALASDNSKQRLADSVSTFTGDPAGTLIEQLEIATDEQTPDYFTSNQVNEHINSVADQFQVTPAVAAAAMREIYIRDPGDDEQSSFWYNSDLTQNTVENRFPMEDIGRIIEESLSQEQISQLNQRNSQAAGVTQRVSQIASEIERLQRSVAKGADRNATAAQISDLILEMTQLQTNNSELFGAPSR